MASYRFAMHPRWLAGHVLVLAVAVGMVFLGRWQLNVSDSKGFDLQNFGYALQWWAFSLFGVGFWIRIIHDKARGVVRDHQPKALPEQDVPYRRYIMPSSPAATKDPELTRYNAYLAELESSPGPDATSTETSTETNGGR